MEKLKRYLFLILISGFFAACAGSPTAEQQQATEPVQEPARSVGNPWIDAFMLLPARELLNAADELDFHPDEDVRLIYTSAEYTYDDEGRLKTVYRTVFQVLTEQGKEGWSDISVKWNPWYQKKPQVKVRVTNPDASENFLKEDQLVESAARENSGKIFSDAKIIRGPLPSVKVGSIIEQEITREESVPYYLKGSMVNWYFKTDSSVKYSRVFINVPESLPFQYKLYNMPDLKPAENTADGIRHYTFSLEDLEPEESVEKGIPSDQYRWEALRFTTAQSWKSIAAFYASQVNSTLEQYDFSREIVEAGIEGLGPGEAAAVLLRQLNKKVRYTGMELGERSIIPAGPEETFARGYGDCKDKALILTGMLRQAGYKAYVALLNVSRTEDSDPDLPGMGWFDHAIVFVDEDGGFWADATSEMSPEAYLPNPDRNRYALIASAETDSLVKTTEKIAAENVYTQDRTIMLADTKQGTVEEKLSYTGALEIFMRNANFNSDSEKLQNSWQDYVNEEYNGGELKDLKVSSPVDLDKPFTVSFTAAGAKCTYTEDYISQIALFPRLLLNWIPDILLEEPEEERENSYSMNFPFTLVRNYRIYPPHGFVPHMLPGPEDYDLGTMSLERSVVQKDEYVLISYRLDTGKAVLSADEFTETGAALREFRKQDPVVINFVHEGQILLEDGDYKAALEKFQELIALDPENARHRLRYARALLKAGFASSAENAIKEAIGITPDSAEFYAELGWILQHDEISRRFYPGYSKAEAIAAYKKAIELDDSKWEYYGNLAILSEYDENGIRYTDREDSLKAAEYYRKARELKDDVLLHNLIINYFYTGEYDKMEELIPKMDDEYTRKAYELLYQTGKNGIDAAVQYAEKNASRDDRRKMFTGTVSHLLQVRNYEAAVRFLREAAKGSSEAVSLEQRADYLSLMKKWEDVKFDSKTPEGAVKSFYKAIILSRSLDFSAVKAVSDPRFYAFATDPEGRKTLKNEYFAILKEAKDGGLGMANILDSMLGGFRIDVDGKDSGAVKVKMIPANGSDPVAIFFLIKKGSDYKIVSLQGYSAVTGKVIADSFREGKTQLAEDLLELFHDEYYNLEDPKDPFFSLNPYEHFYLAKDMKDRILYAGASLMGEGMFVDEAIRILEKGLGSVKGPALDRAPFYYALYYKYLEAEKLSEFSDSGKKLAELLSDSEEAFIRYIRSRPSVDSPDTIEREAREWMSDNEESAEVYKVVLHKYADHQRYSDADRIFSEMNSKNLVGAGEYNNHAWMGLFRPQLTDEDFSNARKAVSMTNSRSDYVLHTMAALYAEIGRCQEARTMLDKEIEMAGEAEINSDEWYVLGRIAEEYGIIDFALEAYSKVKKPDVPEFDLQSCYELTRKRLEIINAKP